MCGLFAVISLSVGILTSINSLHSAIFEAAIWHRQGLTPGKSQHHLVHDPIVSLLDEKLGVGLTDG